MYLVSFLFCCYVLAPQDILNSVKTRSLLETHHEKQREDGLINDFIERKYRQIYNDSSNENSTVGSRATLDDRSATGGGGWNGEEDDDVLGGILLVAPRGGRARGVAEGEMDDDLSSIGDGLSLQGEEQEEEAPADQEEEQTDADFNIPISNW